MSAGRRDQLVTLQRASAVQDGYGEEALTWGVLATEWAQVFYGRGDERRQAAAEQGTQAATFQLLSNETTRGLTIKDRIVANDVNWDVQGISPDTPKRGLLEVTAVRAA